MFFLCFRDEPAGDVDGMAGFSRGECNGCILSKKIIIILGDFYFDGRIGFRRRESARRRRTRLYV